MPSHLRHQTAFEPFSAETTRTSFPPSSPPQKKQKMSLTQTYYIASSARSKLGREASRPDHNLRLLVGHANLLDALMVDLHDAERDQEAWFNQTVKKASKTEEPKHIQWIDSIQEDPSDDADVDDVSETDSDSDDEDFDVTVPLRRLRSPPVSVTSIEVDDDEDDDDDDYYDDMEDDSELALTRTHSHSASPPELIHDLSDSEDDNPPHSPPSDSLRFSEMQRQAIATTTALFDDKQASSFEEEGYFIPERTAPMISAF
ncbi:hypothetical protein K402DRAFT_406729 [Aulographum hederae CBS 113979]|uniref:Uncharacterized protein n=1 Tax=Aulographum hederae CBS 113979 TaxID=1176131 RepID=A0A6G1GSG2_9PEZI|nr:hypothetical protein K402DRAFT_406729 [Aulographum hederae CBS 113979]